MRSATKTPLYPTPSLRVFAVFWWLVVIVSCGVVLALLYQVCVIEDWAAYYLIRNPIAQLLAIDPPPGPSFWDYTNTKMTPEMQAALDELQQASMEVFAEKVRQANGVVIYMPLCVAPYAALTVVRWIITGHWRFGPCW
jgi:hypothetical protein